MACAKQMIVKPAMLFLLMLFSEALASKSDSKPVFAKNDFIRVRPFRVGDKYSDTRHLAYVTGEITTRWRPDKRVWLDDYLLCDKISSKLMWIRVERSEYKDGAELLARLKADGLPQHCFVQRDNWPELPIAKWQDITTKPKQPSAIELNPKQNAVRLLVLESDISQAPLHPCDIFPRLYELCEESGIVIGFGASCLEREDHRSIPSLSSVLFFADFLLAEIEPIYNLKVLTKRSQYPLKSIYLHSDSFAPAGEASRKTGVLSLNIRTIKASFNKHSATRIAQVLHHELQHFIDYGFLGNILPSTKHNDIMPMDNDPEFKKITWDNGGLYYKELDQPQMVHKYAASKVREDRAETWGFYAIKSDKVHGPNVHKAIKEKAKLLRKRAENAGVLKPNAQRAIHDRSVQRTADAEALHNATSRRPEKIPIKTGEEQLEAFSWWKPTTWFR